MKTLPKYIDINIHSFIDLITNSSSEMFITATGKTEKTVKEIIDNVLKLSGSKLTADDLFEFGVYGEVWDEEKETYKTKKFTSEMMEENMSDESPASLTLKVKAKDKSSELGKTTAKLLSELENLFETGERMT